MSHSTESTGDQGDESVVTTYPRGVRVVTEREDERTRYLFEAPQHAAVRFDDAESAELYADVYFDVNGFVEAGTGERGVPPEIVQGGKDTLAAYFLARTDVDDRWVASFYGITPEKVDRYVSWVRERATEVRERVEEHDAADANPAR